jgi:hypothetical protein
VKRQVYGAEKAGELFGPGPVIGHGTSVPASQSIVNPDGSAIPARAFAWPGALAGWALSAGWLRQVRQVTSVDR